jgi:hypothetical protein
LTKTVEIHFGWHFYILIWSPWLHYITTTYTCPGNFSDYIHIYASFFSCRPCLMPTSIDQTEFLPPNKPSCEFAGAVLECRITDCRMSKCRQVHSMRFVSSGKGRKIGVVFILMYVCNLNFDISSLGLLDFDRITLYRLCPLCLWALELSQTTLSRSLFPPHPVKLYHKLKQSSSWRT